MEYGEPTGTILARCNIKYTGKGISYLVDLIDLMHSFVYVSNLSFSLSHDLFVDSLRGEMNHTTCELKEAKTLHRTIETLESNASQHSTHIFLDLHLSPHNLIPRTPLTPTIHPPPLLLLFLYPNLPLPSLRQTSLLLHIQLYILELLLY
jgi:hypothetical protein